MYKRLIFNYFTSLIFLDYEINIQVYQLPLDPMDLLAKILSSSMVTL